METKNSAFLRTISDASIERRDKVVSEMENLRREKLKEAEIEAQRRYSEYLDDQIKSFTRLDGVEEGGRASLTRRNIAEKREHIAKSVFSEVLNKLEKFTNTSEYENFLIKSVKNILSIAGERDVTIYLKPRDLKYKDAIEALSKNISTEPCREIKTGGVKACCPELLINIDDTLDERLAEQVEWFYEKSGLSVNY